MKQQYKTYLNSPAVLDEPSFVSNAQVLDWDELKTVVKFLDVLMEADFELNRNVEGLSGNAR